MPISKTWPSGGTNPVPTTYQIPLNTELNWTTLTNFIQALADSAQGTSFQKFALRRAIATPVSVVATTDCTVVTDLTVAGPVVVNLPAGADKQIFFIMDGKGDGATNNITINRAGADTIRGGTSLVLDRPYGGVILMYNAASTDWKVFGPFITAGGVIPSDFVGILPTTKGGTGVNGTATFPGSGTVAIYPISLTTDVSGILPVANGGTGISSLGAGVATFLGTPSSANLASAVTDETGTGALVFGTSPTITSAALVTPALGTPASGVMTNVTGLPLTTGVTGILPEANGGTGVSSLGAGVATWLGTPSSANLASAVTDETGTGSLVFANSPTFITPSLGTPASGVATNLTGLPLTTGVTGTLPILNGGTGQTTENTALNALLPTQTSSANKFLRTDGTNTLWATATGGAGEINAILNPSGSDGTTGWTGTSVVSGASSPLNPIVTTAFSISNAATPQTSTTGGYYPFTMPTGLANQKLKVQFSFLTPATDVYAVSVYTGTTRVSLSTDASGVSVLPANTNGRFTAYFDSDSSTSWTVGVTRTSGSTGACVITNVIVGPGIQPQGAVVGEWVSYTPTIVGFGSTSNAEAEYMRVGSSLFLRGKFTSGVPTGVTATFSLPFTAAGSPAIPTVGVFGQATNPNGPSGVVGAFTILISPSATVANFSIGTLTASTGSALAPSAGQPVAFVTQAIPIAEWAGSGTVNLAQNDVEWVSNSTTWGTTNTNAFQYGQAGSSITGSVGAAFTQRVRFNSPIQDGDDVVLQFKLPNGKWVETSQTIGAYFTTNAVDFGARFVGVAGSTTDLDVAFSQFSAIGSSLAATTSALNWDSTRQTAWRVRKSSAGAAVGFGIVTPGVSSGLVSASGLPGNTTGSAIASGYVGEKISATVSAYTLTTSEADITGASIPLTAGVWQIYYSVSMDVATSTTFNSFTIGSVVITNSSNTKIGNSYRSFQVRTIVGGASNSGITSLSASETVSISTATNYKLRAVRNDSLAGGIASILGNSVYESTFFAVRIS